MSYLHGYPWQIFTRRAGLDLVHRLERSYDVDRLRAELELVLAQYQLVPHYLPYLTSGWRVVTLLGPEGDPYDHRPPEAGRRGTRQSSKTAVLAIAPYMEEIIDSFDCQKTRVRLMELPPGKDIFWHHDGRMYGLDRKIARLHIPIVTNPNIRFQVSHHDCRWNPGELWFLDNSFPHRLRNEGHETRVHMVIDLVVSDAVRALFPPSMHAQEEARKAVRRRVTRWFDSTYGVVYRVQKRLHLRKLRQAARVSAVHVPPDASSAPNLHASEPTTESALLETHR